eukprot:351272-Chlamydomonas_euryale.AAC.2
MAASDSGGGDGDGGLRTMAALLARGQRAQAVQGRACVQLSREVVQVRVRGCVQVWGSAFHGQRFQVEGHGERKDLPLTLPCLPRAGQGLPCPTLQGMVIRPLSVPDHRAGGNPARLPAGLVNVFLSTGSTHHRHLHNHCNLLFAQNMGEGGERPPSAHIISEQPWWTV